MCLHINTRIWSNMCAYFTLVLFRSISASRELLFGVFVVAFTRRPSDVLGRGSPRSSRLRSWEPGRSGKGHLRFAPQRRYHSIHKWVLKQHQKPLVFSCLDSYNGSWLRGTFSGGSSKALAKLVLCLGCLVWASRLRMLSKVSNTCW